MGDKLLGEGTYAKVYLFAPSAGAMAVRKQFKVDDCDDLQSFAREVDVSTSLRRTTGLRLFLGLYWEEKFKPNLVAELFDGTLHDVFDVGPLPCSRADLLYQLGVGLRTLHGAGFVHGDVTPANAVVDFGRGIAKWTDFGLARRLPLRWHERITTLWYRAPEVERDKEVVYDEKVDVWSFACVVHFVYAEGRPLFSGVSRDESLLDEIDGLTAGEVTSSVPGAGDWVKSLLVSVLVGQRDPKARWTMKELLKHPVWDRCRCRSFDRSEDAEAIDGWLRGRSEDEHPVRFAPTPWSAWGCAEKSMYRSRSERYRLANTVFRNVTCRWTDPNPSTLVFTLMCVDQIDSSPSQRSFSLNDVLFAVTLHTEDAVGVGPTSFRRYAQLLQRLGGRVLPPESGRFEGGWRFARALAVCWADDGSEFYARTGRAVKIAREIADRKRTRRARELRQRAERWSVEENNREPLNFWPWVKYR